MRVLDPLAIPLHGIRLIEASAGTGKTHAISTLYLRLLLEKRLQVSEILLVTFTQAATEEMRGRIRLRIREALAVLNQECQEDETLSRLLAVAEPPDGARLLLESALMSMDEAAIFTIHGFCQRALQENAFESGAFFEFEFLANDSDYLKSSVEDFWRREVVNAGSGLVDLLLTHWRTPHDLLTEIRPFIARRDLIFIPRFNEKDVELARYRAVFADLSKVWIAEAEKIQTLLRQDPNLSRAKEAYGHERVDEAIALMDGFATGSDPQDYYLPESFSLFTTKRLQDSITPAKKNKGAQPPEHEFFGYCQTLSDICEDKIKFTFKSAIDYCRQELFARKRQQRVISYDDLISYLDLALSSPGGNRLAKAIGQRYPVAMIDEFQDTDSAQYRIFSRIYNPDSNHGMFMVGDPKQAIYGFRGGDIFTYIRASRSLNHRDAHYSLDTNWRSSKPLVNAFNQFFSSVEAPFAYAGDIDFHALRAAGIADQRPFLINGEAPPALTCWFVDRDEFELRGKQIPKKQSIPHIAKACAGEVRHLLKGDARIGGAVVQASDIALLVRNKFEAKAIKEALCDSGIPSIYHSRESVYATMEAEELARILSAIAEPGNESLLRAALCSSVIGLDAHRLEALLTNDVDWEETLSRFYDYHSIWRDKGFLPMFRVFLNEQGVIGRLLALPDGERRMTNLLQLSELLQSAGASCFGVTGLLRWFNQQRLEPDGDSEEQQLRLESDADQVRIVTLHKSKGLEYPIVFLPFIWTNRAVSKAPPYLFHDAPDDTLTLDLGSGDNRSWRIADKERLAEDVRLLYVGMTRAKYRCYLTFGGFKGVENSALAYLLFNKHGTDDWLDARCDDVKSFSDEDLRAPLKRLAEKSDGAVELLDLPVSGAETSNDSKQIGSSGDAPLEMRAAEFAGRIDRNWRMTSYSALAAGSSEPQEHPDHDWLTRERVAGAEIPVGENAGIFAFPRGARTGTFMHELLEHLDFPAATGEAFAVEASRLLAKHGFDSELWQPVVETMVRNVLDAPLDRESGLRLREIESNRRIVEMKFYFPVGGIDTRAIDSILQRYGVIGEDTRVLEKSRVKGMMQGFIDLVFEHNGTYYLADYKSNYLGDRLADYAGENLRAAILAHRYDLQYLIYSLALRRYLTNRLADFSYEKQFGGVFYLFLRGIDSEKGPEYGVFFDKPALSLLDELDDLFEAGKGA